MGDIAWIFAKLKDKNCLKLGNLCRLKLYINSRLSQLKCMDNKIISISLQKVGKFSH